MKITKEDIIYVILAGLFCVIGISLLVFFAINGAKGRHSSDYWCEQNITAYEFRGGDTEVIGYETVEIDSGYESGVTTQIFRVTVLYSYDNYQTIQSKTYLAIITYTNRSLYKEIRYDNILYLDWEEVHESNIYNTNYYLRGIE